MSDSIPPAETWPEYPHTMNLQPQLDPVRLGLAAGLCDSVVWQLEVYCDDAHRYCLSVQDAARLQGLADLVTWQAANMRRRATIIHAGNQMYASYFAGKIAVCEDAAGFEASMTVSAAATDSGGL